VTVTFHPHQGMELAPLRGAIVPDSERRYAGQIARFQERLRRLATFDKDEARPELVILIVKLYSAVLTGRTGTWQTMCL